MIRTRFAPSPTGYLHIGGARTALFSWAYARKHGGKFVLRIEDTDLERSTEASVKAILDGMTWLGLAWDEGPFHQMHRLDRYREVAERLLSEGNAYHCYCSKEELEAMREAQRARGDKPRYDGRWRPENAKSLGLTPPAGAKPVVRFRNPLEGSVTFADLVKGPVTVANAELDDLVILRADGVPTYNFGVVVDDLDMNISHVIRGDDHVNNTPRQVNIFHALGAQVPKFAHAPMILGADGERLSKRHGAVSVMQYAEDGYLPEAVLNYLARLGWSHGDAEIFPMQQFIDWFDLERISRSPAQFNPEKLSWLNQQYIKAADDGRLAHDRAAHRTRRGPSRRGTAAGTRGRAAQGARPDACRTRRRGDDVLHACGAARGTAARTCHSRGEVRACRARDAVRRHGRMDERGDRRGSARRNQGARPEAAEARHSAASDRVRRCSDSVARPRARARGKGSRHREPAPASGLMQIRNPHPSC